MQLFGLFWKYVWLLWFGCLLGWSLQRSVRVTVGVWTGLARSSAYKIVWPSRSVWLAEASKGWQAVAISLLWTQSTWVQVFILPCLCDVFRMLFYKPFSTEDPKKKNWYSHFHWGFSYLMKQSFKSKWSLAANIMVLSSLCLRFSGLGSVEQTGHDCTV